MKHLRIVMSSGDKTDTRGHGKVVEWVCAM